MKMKLKIKRTKKFQRDLKRMILQGVDLNLMNTVVEKLACGEKLEEKYHDHALKGEWIGFRECHVTPDWLLIYSVNDNELILTLTSTGSHSYLFG